MKLCISIMSFDSQPNCKKLKRKNIIYIKIEK